jgi:hypothetical protein
VDDGRSERSPAVRQAIIVTAAFADLTGNQHQIDWAKIHSTQSLSYVIGFTRQ